MASIVCWYATMGLGITNGIEYIVVNVNGGSIKTFHGSPFPYSILIMHATIRIEGRKWTA